MKPPKKGGVMMRLALMMDDSDDDLWTIVSSLEDSRYNTLCMRVVLTS